MTSNRTQLIARLSILCALTVVLGYYTKLPTPTGIVTLLDLGVYFTAFYFLFQIISILSYSIHTDKLQKLVNYRLFLLLVIALPLFFLSNLPVVYLIAYILYVFIFYIIQFVLNIYFNKQVSTKTISSLISLKSTISRISGLLILYALSFLLNYMSVSLVISLAFILSLLSILLLLNYFIKNYI